MHRDIKLGNILLSGVPGNEVAKLCDFGLAKSIYFRESSLDPERPHSKDVGTRMYMSPEQLLHKPYNHKVKNNLKKSG